MRIGLIVDGAGEVEALRHVLRQVQSPHDIVLAPVKSKIQPKASPFQIAEQAVRACAVLARKRVDLAVVLIDLEDRIECPGALAQHIQALASERMTRLRLGVQVQVVMKVSQFENWLVADLHCLSSMPKLFPQLSTVIRAVPAGNADGVDALTILRRACGPRGRYDKIQGAKAICTHLDPGRAALNSRSFRRFLRVLEDSRYSDQSRQPSRET